MAQRMHAKHLATEAARVVAMLAAAVRHQATADAPSRLAVLVDAIANQHLAADWRPISGATWRTRPVLHERLNLI